MIIHIGFPLFIPITQGKSIDLICSISYICVKMHNWPWPNEEGYILKRISHYFYFAFDKHLVNQAISADVCVYAESCHLLNVTNWWP